ncbi:hypothetical protein CRUP_020028 [Coryphaenoides rupestris]|nr:hypothetical protein CRUP_020028 [Coryphaenoides rupestris]
MDTNGLSHNNGSYWTTELTNEDLTLYLGRRDYVDQVTEVDSVLFVQLACAFRYGREDLDVMGLSFRKDIWSKKIQIYPESHKPKLTHLHETLMKKAGDNSQPFTIDIPNNLPCSVSLQPGPDDKGKLACAFRYGREDLDVMGLSFRKDIWSKKIQIYPESHKPKLTHLHETLMKKAGDNSQPFTIDACGVDFEVKTYLSLGEDNNADEKISKKDTARLIIRKIQYAPNQAGAGPKTELRKNFMHLFFHGDSIPIKIKVNNETTKTVKNIKITVDQSTDIILYCADKYTKCVLSKEFNETVDANGTLEKTLCITPLLSDNKEKRGLALDGRLKDEDTNLASTTVLRKGMEKDMLGILVSYKIHIHLMVAGAGKDANLGDK